MGLTTELEAFVKELYIEMYHSLLAYAQIALGDYHLAEEAVQDTFRIACAKINSLTSSKNPNGWIVKTHVYVIKNMSRSRARLNNVVIESLSQNFTDMYGKEDDIAIETMYSDLIGSDDFKLIKSIVLDNRTILEMSKALGISVDACKKRLQRAKKKLQKILKDYL